MAATAVQPQYEEVIHFEWDLPSLLRIFCSSEDRPAKTEFILGATTLVARGEYVEVFNCRQYLDKFFPEIGVSLVKAIIESLDAVEDTVGKLIAC